MNNALLRFFVAQYNSAELYWITSVIDPFDFIGIVVAADNRDRSSWKPTQPVYSPFHSICFGITIIISKPVFFMRVPSQMLHGSKRNCNRRTRLKRLCRDMLKGAGPWISILEQLIKNRWFNLINTVGRKLIKRVHSTRWCDYEHY